MTQVHRPDDEAPHTRSAQPAVAAVAVGRGGGVQMIGFLVGPAPPPPWGVVARRRVDGGVPGGVGGHPSPPAPGRAALAVVQGARLV
uniref:hypothetical protein n=1 Tax=Nocardia farcinica TaxID=37329 RepID=UPI0024541483